MTPAEQLQIWRAELVEEIAAFETELEAEREPLAEAETRYAEALAARKEIVDFVNRGVARRHTAMADLSAALHGRLETEGRQELKEASTALGRVRLRIKVLQERIEGRRLGITQIDDALIVQKVTPLKPVAELPARRNPPLVQFDTITMPAANKA